MFSYLMTELLLLAILDYLCAPLIIVTTIALKGVAMNDLSLQSFSTLRSSVSYQAALHFVVMYTHWEFYIMRYDLLYPFGGTRRLGDHLHLFIDLRKKTTVR